MEKKKASQLKEKQQVFYMHREGNCSFAFENPNGFIGVSGADGAEVLAVLNQMLKAKAIAKLLEGE